jgi:methyltransferase
MGTAGVGVSVSLAPLFVLLVVMLMMLVETLISRRHERTLRERGAVEPTGDVYATMRWAYPAAFLAMGMEGTLFGPPPTNVAVCGAVLLTAAKALKWWAMASLGVRWTFRVLVMPGAPLVTHGPYAIWRHPNYIAVVGELLAMALLVGARVTGPLATLWFSWLIWRRIRVEDRALRY